MKKLLSFALVAAMLLSSVAAFAAPTSAEIQAAEKAGDIATLENLMTQEETEGSSVSATVTINDTAAKTYNRDLLGVQWEVSSRGSYFLNPDSGDLSPGFRNFANKMFDSTVARWGGGSTNLVNLRESIKPLPERQDVYHVDDATQLMSRAADMGPVEFFKANLAINPDTKFVIVIGPWANSPQDVLDFTHFMLDTEGEWAELRKSYGLKDPLNLMAYEMGNENYFTAEPGNDAYSATASQDYIDKAIPIIEAVRADFPDVVFTANVRGRGVVTDGVAWDDQWIVDIAKGLHSYIDGNVSYHSYYMMDATNANMDRIITKYKEGAGSSATVKFWITENAQFGAAGQNVERHDLNSALFNMVFLNEIGEREDVVCANYHNVAAENWTLFSVLGGRYFSQSTNDIYRLYETKMGSKYYPTTETTSASGIFSALATVRDDGRMVIGMVNMDESTPLHVRFTYNSGEQYKLIHKTTYTGPNSMSAVVSEKTANIFTTTEANSTQDPFTAITVPAKSVVFAVAEKKTGTYGTYVEPLIEDTSFPAVERSYKDVQAGDAFVTKGTEPDNVIYVQKTANADANTGVPGNVPVAQLPAFVDTAKLVGSGETVTLLGGTGNQSPIAISNTEFAMTPPYNQNTLGGVNNATLGMGGGLIFSGGPGVGVTQYNHRRDMLTWSPAAFKQVEGQYTLKVSANKDSYTSLGIRFHMDANLHNYYMLYLKGSARDNNLQSWELYKVTDGALSSAVLKSTYNTNISGDFEVALRVDGSTITVTVTSAAGATVETKSYTDSSFFTFDVTEAGTIGFIKSDAGTSSKANPDILIKSLALETDLSTASLPISADLTGLTASDTKYAIADADGDQYADSQADVSVGVDNFYLAPPLSGNKLFSGGKNTVVKQEAGSLDVLYGPGEGVSEFAARHSLLKWKPAALKDFGNDYRYTLAGNVHTSNNGLGFRFHISEDEKSYYLLAIGSCNKEPSGHREGWRLYKVTDGSVSVLMKSETVTEMATSGNGYIQGFTATITVEGADITVHLTGTTNTKVAVDETFTVTDGDPFTHDAHVAGYAGFFAVGGAETTGASIYSISLEELVDGNAVAEQEKVQGMTTNGAALGSATVTNASFTGGDGVTYTGSATDQTIGTTDFKVVGPGGGNSPVGSPVKATMASGGPLVLSAGINQAALNLNYRKCMVVWAPSAMSSVTNKYRIVTDAYVENSLPGLGIRFHISADKQSYYMLYVNGPNKDSGKPVWSLYKVVEDEVREVMWSDVVSSVDSSNYMRYDYTADITMMDNAITVRMIWNDGKTSESKTFVDQEPFSHDANASGYVGFVKNGGGSVNINSVRLEKYTASTREEYHRFGSGLVLRKVENPNSTPALVYVNDDTDGVYELLGVVPANGKFVNGMTAKNVRNIKVVGGQDLRFYSALEDTAAYTATTEIYPLSARVNGVDLTNPTFTSSKDAIITIADGMLVPVQTGSATITATQGSNTYTSPAVNSRIFGTWTESFDSYGTVAEVNSSTGTNIQDVTVAGNWVLRQNIEEPVTANPKAKIEDGVMYFSAPALEPMDKRMTHLVYAAPLSGLGGEYTMTVNAAKYNAASGIGIKFHMHDAHDQSFYVLMINGAYGDTNTWSFYKYERGIKVATVQGPTFTSYSTSGDGAYKGGDFSVTISVKGNEISWSITGTRVGESETVSTGSFTDENFTPISGAQGRIGFIASNASNVSINGFNKIYDVTIVEGTGFDTTTVKSVDQGNFVILYGEDFDDNTRIIQMEQENEELVQSKIFKKSDLAEEGNPVLYIPRSGFGKTKVLIWNMNGMVPIRGIITETGEGN